MVETYSLAIVSNTQISIPKDSAQTLLILDLKLPQSDVRVPPFPRRLNTLPSPTPLLQPHTHCPRHVRPLKHQHRRRNPRNIALHPLRTLDCLHHARRDDLLHDPRRASQPAARPAEDAADQLAAVEAGAARAGYGGHLVLAAV